MKKEIKRYLGVITIVLGVTAIGYTSAYMIDGFGAVSEKADVEVGIEESSFIHFSNTGGLNLEAGSHNLYDGAGNVTEETVSSVTLKGSALSLRTYSIYLEIGLNNFVYSSNTNEPELLLNVYNHDGTEIKLIEGLEYVTINGKSGFDVTTTKFSSITIGEYLEIEIPLGTTTITQDYRVTLTMVNLDTNQNINSGRKFNAELIFVEDNKYHNHIYHTILDNYNTTYEELLMERDPDFSKMTTASEKSIHTAEDDYTKTTKLESIYFRGAVDNNWVYFGGFYWRIVRIDGAGNVKLIYSGTTAPTASQSVVMTGTGTQIGTTYFNYSTTPLGHLWGYMYSATESHGATNSSTLKNSIDTWYKNNLLNSSYEEYISDAIYCGDRSGYSDSSIENLSSPSNIKVYGTGSANVSSGGALRIYKHYSPILKCYYQEDRYTIEDVENGNGNLTYPVATISGDELMLAGSIRYDGNNTTNYIYTNQSYFSMTPNFISTTLVNVFGLLSTGELSPLQVNHTTASSIDKGGIRPTITVNANTPFTGSGTYDDPFSLELSDN